MTTRLQELGITEEQEAAAREAYARLQEIQDRTEPFSDQTFLGLNQRGIDHHLLSMLTIQGADVWTYEENKPALQHVKEQGRLIDWSDKQPEFLAFCLYAAAAMGYALALADQSDEIIRLRTALENALNTIQGKGRVLPTDALLSVEVTIKQALGGAS